MNKTKYAGADAVTMAADYPSPVHDYSRVPQGVLRVATIVQFNDTNNVTRGRRVTLKVDHYQSAETAKQELKALRELNPDLRLNGTLTIQL